MARGLRVDPENAMMRYIFAGTLAAVLGDREEAVAMLGSVLARAPGVLGAVRTNPDFASIRDDPRFVAIVAEADARLAAVEGAPANAAS
ncbi:MAG: TPR end-of-group domain-containing protein [Caulobacteraceae bacterium]